MKNKLLVTLSMIFLLVVSTLHAQDEFPNAIVTGHVLASDGQAVVGARVVPFPLEMGMSGPIPFAISGKDGYYRLKTPAFGNTRICASKVGEGYPDTTAAIFLSGGEHEPVVNLKAESFLQDVDVRLPPPDGSLELTIVDEESLQAIGTARVLLRRTEDKDVRYATNIGRTGRFKVELPPRAIQVEISAPGYLPWLYKEETTNNPYVKLLSGQRLSVLVKLARYK